MRAIIREILKGAEEAVEINKAFFSEWWMELPYGIGNILTYMAEEKAQKMGYDEIIVPPGILGDWGNSRAQEVGSLRYKFGKAYIKGYSRKGFYVERGKKSEAVAFLRSVGLDVS